MTSAQFVDTSEPDTPFRELSFEGGLYRQPTTECLVYLTGSPFLVVTLAEIEIASLERVQYSSKQFDLVLIFKRLQQSALAYQFNTEFTNR